MQSSWSWKDFGSRYDDGEDQTIHSFIQYTTTTTTTGGHTIYLKPNQIESNP